jgi:hypothetical protein
MKEDGAVDKDQVTKALKAKSLDLGNAEKVVRQKAQREISFAFGKPST